MKRIVPLFTLLALAAGLVPFLGVLGKASPPSTAPKPSNGWNSTPKPLSPSTAPSVTRTAGPTKASSANEKLVQELVAILRETRSAETFLVTSVVLGRIGPDAKAAIPEIIRNAERLELFADLKRGGQGGDGEMVAEGVMAAIEDILGAGGMSRPRGGAGAYGAPIAGYPPAYYPSGTPCAPVTPTQPPSPTYSTPPPVTPQPVPVNDRPATKPATSVPRPPQPSGAPIGSGY